MTTILHTESSPGWGGQEMRVHLELIGLRERGHRMLLACHPESELAKRAERAGLEVWCLVSETHRSQTDLADAPPPDAGTGGAGEHT